jgi:hypothetical protein
MRVGVGRNADLSFWDRLWVIQGVPSTNLLDFTSQARRDSPSPRRYREAPPSVAGRLASRRRKDLRSWLLSCKSRTLFAGTHRRKLNFSGLARWLEPSSSRAKGYRPTTIARQKEQQWVSFDFSWREVNIETGLPTISTKRQLYIATLASPTSRA